MTPADLSRTVLHAVRRAVAEDALRAPVPARVRVERTRPGGRGEYACAVALQLAGPAALPARDVAAILRERVLHAPGIGDVEITGPGFLNFTLSAGAHGLDALVRTVGAHGTAYGHGDALAGTKVSFVPVEELRARVVTEAVERLLRSQGATVGERTTGGEALHVVPVPAADRDLFDRLGNDAARWALLRAAPHDRPRDTGGGALLVQQEGNPLFRVRYAHARIRALGRNARQLGFGAAYEESVDAPELVALLADHPGVLAAAARHREPDRVARQLEALAHAFFDFHDSASPLPVGDEKPSAAHRSRLAVAEAAGRVLAGGLSLLGISAPEVL
ncbi:ArgS-related anticodon-binding protein NrtL [Streptomyces sp. JV190]|uniref:ArgS-related anticodon-binding protein NrtL n=1 Tax=Streptomyces sp. JV190 TaxID=3002533 RepID=UPI002E78AF33|nr:DALR anticodon-binding domain-containing protein [Streptomyces sp. JV190]MEE1841926.1 DALR anticodon-binding domain-containing protein [Streptomyces sp. JV190]